MRFVLVIIGIIIAALVATVADKSITDDFNKAKSGICQQSPTTQGC